jgi:hypothetical protein
MDAATDWYSVQYRTIGKTLSAPSSSLRKKRPPPVECKESFATKQERVLATSANGRRHPGWKLLPILIKSNDDLRQEQLASQFIIYQMACILAREHTCFCIYGCVH